MNGPKLLRLSKWQAEELCEMRTADTMVVLVIDAAEMMMWRRKKKRRELKSLFLMMIFHSSLYESS
jgi:hypothetical protein